MKNSLPKLIIAQLVIIIILSLIQLKFETLKNEKCLKLECNGCIDYCSYKGYKYAIKYSM